MITSPPEAVANMFAAQGLPNYPPRYNVAPTNDVLVVRGGERGRELLTMRWGLVPGYEAEIRTGKTLINARSETVARAEPFWRAFARRRCLLPADGYFEWRAVEDGRQPYLVRRRDRSVFAFAGLWEHWYEPARIKSPPLLSCTILTTGPSNLVLPIHDRMPLILNREEWAPWLREGAVDNAMLGMMAHSSCDDDFECIAVSRRVNSVANDDAACIEPAGKEAQIGFLL